MRGFGKMVKKEHLDAVETWLDECFNRAYDEKLYGTMLEIMKEKDAVKKLRNVEEPIVVQHVITDETKVKPLTQKLKEFVKGSG